MILRTVPPLLFFLIAAGSSGAQDWYRSSAAGTIGSPLSISSPEDEGWIMSVDRESVDGELFDGADEKEIRTLYSDGEKFSSTIFYRSGGRLTVREELDASGEIISRVEYAYDGEGNPRAVYISRDSASETFVEKDTSINPDGRIHRHTGGSGGDWTITDLDRFDQPLSRKILVSGTVVEESSWKRSDDGTLREKIVSSGSDELRSRYDSEGRLLEETTIRNGLVVLVRTYHWTSDKLSSVEERGEGRVLLREMQWSGERIINETRSEDGVVVSRTEWTSPDERVETLYRDGEAVIRVYWKADTRVKEEFLRDGEVIRTREGGA